MSHKKQKPDQGRRQFMTGGAMVAGVVSVVPGVLLAVSSEQTGEGASSENRWGMLIDTQKCAAGCSACVDACEKENGIDLIKKPESLSDEMWDAQRPQWVRKVQLRDKQTNQVTQLPLMCQHCEHPPCVDVCPTGASFKRADGIVMVDRHTCIGCRYCMMACPYKARSFIHQDIEDQRAQTPRGKGCVESCNLCVGRIDAGQSTTACMDACNSAGHEAILFGDLKDPNSELAKTLKEKASQQIRADLELNTGIRYSGL